MSLSLRPIMAKKAVASRISYGTRFCRLYRCPVWHTEAGDTFKYCGVAVVWVEHKLSLVVFL